MNLIVDALLALIPIAFLILALAALRMSSALAGWIAYAAAALLALVFWRTSFRAVLESTAEGIFLAFCPVIWVIFAALFTYNLMTESGAMDTIRSVFTGISEDKRIQVLLIVFAFGGFMEAVAGFGTAVAIPAGILVSMGFAPLFAAAICLVSNTVAVAFGVAGIPIVTLANVTGLDVATLAVYTAIQLLLPAILLPMLLVVMTAGGIKKARGALLPAFVCGTAFGLTQLVMAFIAPELAAILGTMMAFFVLIVMNKPKQRIGAAFVKAAMPYILILALALCTSLIPSFDALKRGPFLLSVRLFSGEGGAVQNFAWLTNPGTMFFIAGLISAAVWRMKPSACAGVLLRTARQMRSAAVAITAVLCMARVMSHSGMISSIALALAQSGVWFAAVSPLLGALGTFITGSDTSSNVLFGPLQKQTALETGMNAAWLAAGNASGATVGKMLSPQSIAIVKSAIGLKAPERELLKYTFRYALAMAALLSLTIWAGSVILS